VRISPDRSRSRYPLTADITFTFNNGSKKTVFSRAPFTSSTINGTPTLHITFHLSAVYTSSSDVTSMYPNLMFYIPPRYAPPGIHRASLWTSLEPSQHLTDFDCICYGRPRKSSKGLLPRVYFRRDYVASHRFLDASEVGSCDYDVSRSFSSSG
jgi:hypothetical protein